MSTLTVATVKSNSSSPPVFQNTSGTEVGTLCRAWVNFNGTGTVAIRAQFNVSSITDHATGQYTVNFTNALADANYAFSAAAGTGTVSNYVASAPQAAPTTSSLRIYSGTTGGWYDLDYVAVAIFR